MKPNLGNIENADKSLRDHTTNKNNNKLPHLIRLVYPFVKANSSKFGPLSDSNSFQLFFFESMTTHRSVHALQRYAKLRHLAAMALTRTFRRAFGSLGSLGASLRSNLNGSCCFSPMQRGMRIGLRCFSSDLRPAGSVVAFKYFIHYTFCKHRK